MDPEQLRSELAAMSCGHSCVIAKPRGMGTNGGCRCLHEMSTQERFRITRAFWLYRDLVKTLDVPAKKTTKPKRGRRGA